MYKCADKINICLHITSDILSHMSKSCRHVQLCYTHRLEFTGQSFLHLSICINTKIWFWNNSALFTFSCCISIGKWLVGSLPHEFPLILVVVPTTLDDLLVKALDGLRHLDFAERRVETADVKEAHRRCQHTAKEWIKILVGIRRFATWGTTGRKGKEKRRGVWFVD